MELKNLDKLTYTPEEAGELLGMHANRIRDLIKAKKLGARNISSGSQRPRWLIPVGAIQKFLQVEPDPIAAEQVKSLRRRIDANVQRVF